MGVINSLITKASRYNSFGRK